MIIDTHVHLGRNWDENCYAISEKRLSRILRENGVDRAIVFPQPRPYPETFAQCTLLEEANDRVGKYSRNDQRIIPACYVDHRNVHAAEEIERCVKEYDIRAVKFHPGMNVQRIREEPVFNPPAEIMKTIGDYGLLVILHPPRYDEGGVKKVADGNPDTNFIVAHFGMLNLNLLQIARGTSNVYVDSSAITSLLWAESALAYVGDYFKFPAVEKSSSDNVKDLNRRAAEHARKAIDFVGKTKVVFGSDTPWTSLLAEIDTMREAGAGEEIFAGNAERLLGG